MRFLEAESAEWVYQINLSPAAHVNGVFLVGKGGLDHAPCDVRECLKAALLGNSNRFVLVHNHPSGDPEPGGHDVQAAQRVARAAALLDLRLEDFVVVASAGFVSLRERGCLGSAAPREDGALRQLEE